MPLVFSGSGTVRCHAKGISHILRSFRAIETRHAMSFTAAKELFPLSDYLDIAYTQQFLPIVDFQEFSILRCGMGVVVHVWRAGGL